jgi:ATP-dependent helicase/nuclease subunit B
LLYISYPAAEPRRASAIVRSPFIDNLCLLFNDLEEESPVSTISSVEDVLCQSDLDDLLCFTKDDRLSQLAPRVTGALAYENKAELSNEIVKKLFANHTTTSSSRLSTFAACPYRHFAKYVLELKKRDEFKLEPLDVGDFYHRVLDGFTKRVVAEKLNFETVEQAKLNKILNEEAEKLLQQDTFIAKFTAHGPHNSFVISEAMEYLLDYLADISQMIRAGCFRPALSEVAFGDVESAGPGLGEFAVTLSDGRQLLLNGRIDRIDIAQINRQKIALIFDYKKRSKKSFNWAEFFYGLDMQLPIYILALLKSPDSQKIATGVAGAFYLPIEAGPEALSPHEIAEGTGRTVRRAKGLFNGEYYKQLDSAVDSGWSDFYSFQVTEDKGQYANYDRSSALRPGDFEAAINFAENKIAQIAQQILSGQIEARPYRLSGRSPCAECEYKPVCRFDWQINDYNLLTALDKRQSLETIKNADDAEKN